MAKLCRRVCTDTGLSLIRSSQHSDTRRPPPSGAPPRGLVFPCSSTTVLTGRRAGLFHLAPLRRKVHAETTGAQFFRSSNALRDVSTRSPPFGRQPRLPICNPGCRQPGNGAFHRCSDFPAIGAGANSGTQLSSSRGKSHRQNHLPPDRIAGIMPASRGWFPGAKGRERGDGLSIGAIHPYDVRRRELDRPKES